MNPAPRRSRSVSLFWLIPNILTVAGLISGLTALRFALDGRWAAVIGLIALAAVFDALDGRTARRFKTSSAFSAALDSHRHGCFRCGAGALYLGRWDQAISWWATMFYTVAIALRLARFDRKSAIRRAVRIISLAARHQPFWLVRLSLISNSGSPGRVRQAMSALGWAIGGLAVSAVPTFAGKRLKLPVGTVLPVLAGGSILIAGMFMQPFITYLVLAGAYVMSIPVAVVRFYHQDSGA